MSKASKTSDKSEYFEIVTRCFGQTVIVRANNSKVVDYISSSDHHTQQRSVLNNIEPCEAFPSLNITEGRPTILTYDYSSRSLNFQVEWNLIDRSGAIDNLYGQLLRLSCFDSGIFPFHAAAFSVGDNAYLLVGDVGAGKTNLAVSLCIDPIFKLVSNDWVGLSINNMEIMVSKGDDWIDFRKMAFTQLSKTLSKKCIEKILPHFPSDTTPWIKSDFKFSPSDLGLVCSNLPLRVNGIFLPLITRNTYQYIGQLERKRASMNLLQELLWPLRGIRTFILDNDGYILCPSVVIIPRNGWEQLCDFINSLISQCPIYVVHAPFEVAREFIKLKTSKNE